MALISYSGGGAIGMTRAPVPTWVQQFANQYDRTRQVPVAKKPTWLQQYDQRRAAQRNATTVAQAKYRTQYYNQKRAMERNATTVAQARRNASQWYQQEYGNQNRTYLQNYADNMAEINARVARETAARQKKSKAVQPTNVFAGMTSPYSTSAPTNVIYQSPFDLLMRGQEGPQPYQPPNIFAGLSSPYSTSMYGTPNYGGYGGYSGYGGYNYGSGGGGGVNTIPATPDIPTWIYGLINWRV